MRRASRLALAGVLLAAPTAAADDPAPDAAAAYAARATKLRADDADGWAALGAWCRAQGLALEAEGAFAAALRAHPEHAAARAALGYVRHKDAWLREADAWRAKGFVRYGERWVLPAERDYLRRRDCARGAGLEPGAPAAEWAGKLGHGDADVRAAAARALAALPAEDRVRVLAETLETHREAATRAAAAEQLGALRHLGGLRALARASVKDPEPSVRAAALSGLKAHRYREAPLYLAAGMRSPDPETRARAIEHLGTFQGDVLAARALADHFVVGFGGGPRVNFYSLNQIAYIRDFDVEVAQNATIGDPIVGRIEEGVVQDHKVLGGQEMVPASAFALAGAFERVTGQHLGHESPEPYRRWLAESLAGEGR